MIFDCFTFFNELDVLEIRLHTLNPHVDKFVLCEADTTFQGQRKPMHYLQNCKRFCSFANKIIHVPLRYKGQHGIGWSAWDREGFQRKMLRTNLMATGVAEPGDIVLLSDVDEIPNLEARVMNTAERWDQLVRDHKPVVWVHDMTYYWVNWYAAPWRGTIAMLMGDVDRVCNGDMQALREARGRAKFMVYPHGGWHMAWLGGADAISTKLAAFSHTELGRFNTQENITAKLKTGADLFDRKLYEFRELTGAEVAQLPKYLYDNPERFKHLWMPKSVNV